MIVGVFIANWTPITIIFFVVGFSENDRIIQENGFLQKFYVLSMFIAHLNSVLNPIIYAYRIKDIRENLKKIFKCNKNSSNMSQIEPAS